MIGAILENERRDNRAHRRHLAARKTVVALALKPKIGIARLSRTRARENMLKRFGRNTPDGGRVDRLPECLTDGRFTALPQRARDLSAYQCVFQCLLIAPLPDAVVVVG